MKLEQKKIYSSTYYKKKYSSTRYKKEHLFESEKYLLTKYLKPNMKVLDIGCATGGFSQILKEIEPTTKYTGIDLSSELIQIAKDSYPDYEFNVIDASKKYNYPHHSFDCIQAWGVTVHESEYKELLTHAWKTTKKTLLFDMRLQTEDSEILDRDICYVLNPSGVKNFYIIANALDFLNFLLTFKPKPSKIDIFGYLGQPNKFVHLPEEHTKEIYMVGVGIEKLDSKEKTIIQINLPQNIKKRILNGLISKDDILFLD